MVCEDYYCGHGLGFDKLTYIPLYIPIHLVIQFL